MRFVLVRHGQSVNNLLWEQTGDIAVRDPDPRLTELGHEQARLVAGALADGVLPWQVTDLYSSLMARAIQTAAPVADALDLPLHAHPELFECGGPYVVDDDKTTYRAHAGSGRAELAALSPRLRLPDGASEDGWWPGPFEDQETAYADRARRVIGELREACADDAVVVVVTHGWFTQYLVRELLGISSMKGWIKVENTGITLLEDDKTWGTVTALRLNWLPHLSAAQLSH